MTEQNMQVQQDELQHIFVAYGTAKQGGTQQVTSRSGKTYEVKIPANCLEETKLRLKKRNLQKNKNSFKGIISKIYENFSPEYIDNENDIIITVHTLFDNSTNIEKIIYDLINNADIKLTSKEKCANVYQNISDAKSIDDLPALNLLDFIVSSSQVNSSVSKRYNIASQNSRLCKIEQCIENALTASNLNKNERQFIRGTYQCIKAGENIADFDILNQLDTIIQNSSLLDELKQIYFRYSVTARASTADLFIVDIIDNCSSIKSSTYKSEILSNYVALRDGKQVSEQANLKLLDSLILDSQIPDDCKVIYKLMREPVSNQNGKKNDDVFAKVKKVRSSVNKAAGIVPTAIQIASTTGIKAGTGVAISTLSGGAATNATLALLGGGSVAAGGLGMLGGLAVATGGAALIGAAALVSVASVSQMDAEDKKKLGIAAGVGVATSAAAVSTAWAAMGAFGVASTGTAISTLSGAAAYSSIMAALGGVGVMTGGAAVIAAGAGFAAWKFFTGDKNDPKWILKQLEAKLYS
ncbi:hypothetical protein [Nodularia sp. UHCC 0506]|uniref:hypothetical protein n=1 Tax=Nodularia sp. UHCC 0506 TaxID=3110243 RepID=UPI002B21B885|nr:hypothetical protein [Nodularia sp. UHCC 0506]MEA5513129.1 hypothetical protein [Nodularia sp. UHCC 0506]